ncbi:MAG TPA: MnmC family methyltransferase [Oligoflexus sp.]|uniref:MnmC family methyltransferase n=1 Tax=Oligoflexus sp. TaxID=1971216 RepID=UPI002D543AFF|nr:MnmC family methyltransferase [Oligoflexus sp.]HYX38011.1 MnmC family methyltransferase [Oligoflexus sp.]
MSSESFELITLKSGHTSLRLISNQETFHPVIGPEAEARLLHVEQQRLVARSQGTSPFIVWDVGLGAAANAVATLEALSAGPATVELHSFDHTLAPLQFACDHSEHLAYIRPYRLMIQQLMRTGQTSIGRLRWFLHCADFRVSLSHRDLPPPHAILYDPYSAVSNPEMWTLEHFQKLRRALHDDRPCLLTNYTRSTAVRSTWLLAGFYVGIGVGIGEKNQTTIASNQLELLDQPLPISWLKQVAASQNSNPLREGGSAYGPMSAEDFEQLRQHPQFQPRSLCP